MVSGPAVYRRGAWPALAGAIMANGRDPRAPSDLHGGDAPFLVDGTHHHLNGVVGEHDVLDQTTLPPVKMPNREGFVADTRPDTGA